MIDIQVGGVNELAAALPHSIAKFDILVAPVSVELVVEPTALDRVDLAESQVAAMAAVKWHRMLPECFELL
jgi:hypothetical protein